MRVLLKAVMVLGALALGSPPVMAQNAIEGRVGKLEREMRAVQRKVFPGANGQVVAPDITPPETTEGLPGTPASSPEIDIIARVHALESQMSSMTGQVEQTQHRLQLLEQAFADFQRATDTRLKALEDRSGAASAGAAPDSAPPVVTDAAPPKATPAPPPVAGADLARARLVAAVEKPTSADPADDGYVYGYRLWAAKLYPEAEAVLKQVVAKYPSHRRASWAQNLLGRAYLDEGKPSLASLAFYENYKKFPQGERAPESLFYLATALKKLGKPAGDVCKVYDELTDAYPSRISPGMRADIARGRVESKCATK